MTSHIELQQGTFFLVTEDCQGELELGDTFEEAIDSLFACKGDVIDNEMLKKLIVELHELCE